MLAVIFMWKPTGTVALIFYQELPSPIKEQFCAYISWNAEKGIELSEQYCYSLFKKVQ